MLNYNLENNIISFLLLIVIISIVIVDWYHRKNKKSKAVSIKNDQKKSSLISTKIIIYLSIVLLFFSFGFYSFYVETNKVISEISNSNEELKKLLTGKMDVERFSKIKSEISSNFKKLDDKLFVYKNYETEEAKFRLFVRFFDFKSFNIFFDGDPDNLVSKICNLTEERMDSLKLLKSTNLSLLEDYDGKVNLNFEPLDKEIILIDLIDLYYNKVGCADFFLSKVTDLISKKKFEDLLDKFAAKYENSDYLEKINVIADPIQINILNFLGKTDEGIDIMYCKNEFGGESKLNFSLKNAKKLSKRQNEQLKCNILISSLGYYTEDNLQRLEFLYNSLMTFYPISKDPEINTETKELLFYILTLAVESNDFSQIPRKLLIDYFKKQDIIYPFESIFNTGLFVKRKKYKALDSKSKTNFKETIAYKVLYNPSSNLRLNEKLFLINSYMEAAFLDNQYSEVLEGHKEIIKSLESENISDATYGLIASSFFRLGSMQFEKRDYLNSIKNIEKAIKYIDIGQPHLFENTKAHFLRNLFSAKWNYNEYGDKMGACDDLRNAANLDSSYYSYYLKNCVN